MYTEANDGHSTRTDLEPKETHFYSNSVEFLFTDHMGTILESDFFVVCGYSKRLEEIEKCTEKVFSFEDTELNKFYGQYFGVMNLSNYSIRF